MLPRLLERAGAGERGSITGVYTVLVEGDDMNEPVADTVRGVLDGHVILSRKIAARNFYPAVDVLESISRVMPSIVSKDHIDAAGKIRELLAVYGESEDLIGIGAYKRGTSPRVDWALEHLEDVREFLRQSVDEKVSFEAMEGELIGLIP
ncbi:hypothetical protein MASR2M79_16170 [Aminivibrio sp.]